MKIFFTTTYEGKENFGEYYLKLFQEIKSLGYEHLDNEAAVITYKEYVDKMSRGREEQVKNYHQKMNYIQKADICIIESSAHSLGNGFIVQKAL
ncbi:hypothetical protein COV58_04330, partial [Candidatus Roizmanbacteria bacterium CG11_big_fil_rev_8_21_14_0_20_36_8]